MPVLIAFEAEPYETDGPTEVVPVLDGVKLTDRIHAFERDHGIETRAVSYAGLIPAHFRFGSADEHYLANESSVGPTGKIPVLGCQCGEWGCWPLLARVIVDETTVTWTEFEQPYRPDRDYTSFGPFVFRRTDYEAAIADLAGVWS
jgi:hypothetical protein